MALWAGVESWETSATRVAALIVGLTLVAAGAATLARSKTVARESGAAGSSERGEQGTSSAQRRVEAKHLS